MQFILLAIGLIGLGQFAITIYSPSMPAMVYDLHTNEASIQNSLTVFLIGFALAQLLSGPLSDKIGRKPVIFIGAGIFLVGSVFTVAAFSIKLFFIGRIVQGVGAGCVSSIARAILRDVFSDKKLHISANVVSIGIVFIPLLAPILGGYLHLYLGWRFNFIFMMIFGLLIFVVTFFISETNTKKIENRLFFYKNYLKLLSNKSFIGYAMCVALMYSCTTAYYLIAPFLFQNGIGFKPEQYGWIPMFTVVGYILGSLLGIGIGHRVKTKQFFVVGFLFLMVGSSSAAILALFGCFNIYSLIIPMFIFMVGEGVILPASVARSLINTSTLTGFYAAALGTIQMLGASLAGMLIAKFHDNGQMLLAIILVAVTILTILTFFTLCHKKENMIYLRAGNIKPDTSPNPTR